MLATIGWCVLLVAGVLWNLFVLFAGDAGCARRTGDSNYGRLEWSAVPPGPRCVSTKQLNGVDASDGPGWEESAYLIVLVTGGLALLRANGQSRQPRWPGEASDPGVVMQYAEVPIAEAPLHTGSLGNDASERS